MKSGSNRVDLHYKGENFLVVDDNYVQERDVKGGCQVSLTSLEAEVSVNINREDTDWPH